MFFDPPTLPGKDLVLPVLEEEGVVALFERKARLALMEGNFDDVLASLERQFPWLLPWDEMRESEEEDDEELEYEVFWSAGSGVMGFGEEAHSPMIGTSWIQDPHWILDALAGADNRTTRAGEDFVHGLITTRYEFRSDLKQAEARAPVRFQLPPHGKVAQPTIMGETWIDADGLIRRVTWRQPLRSRPRLRRLQRSSPPVRLWQSVELTAFGEHIEIQIPEADPPSEPSRRESLAFSIEIFDFVRHVWNRRRAWRKAHPVR
jgi:hypothetical protein